MAAATVLPFRVANKIRMAWRTLSLNSRQLLAAESWTGRFLGLTGYALDRALSKKPALSNFAATARQYARPICEIAILMPRAVFNLLMHRAGPTLDRPGSGLFAVQSAKGLMGSA